MLIRILYLIVPLQNTRIIADEWLAGRGILGASCNSVQLGLLRDRRLGFIRGEEMRSRSLIVVVCLLRPPQQAIPTFRLVSSLRLLSRMPEKIVHASLERLQGVPVGSRLEGSRSIL